MKQKIKNYTIHFIKEIIPVIAGILIALFIDNWNSERKDKAFMHQVFSTIDSELKDSKDDIKAIMPQQESLIDSLDFYADNKAFSVMDVVMRSKGIYIPQIKMNAWKSVSNTKIDLIEYQKITSLTNIEDLKEILDDKSKFLMSFLYSNVHDTDKSTKQTLKMIIMDIMQTERSLQQSIEQFEEK